MTVERKRIRMAVDPAKRTTEQLVDIATSASPELWRGNDVQFELGIYDDDVFVLDLSNIASLTLDIKSTSDLTGTPLATRTLAAGDLSTITEEQWNAGTHQHALIPFTGTEMNLYLGGETRKTFWLAIGILTNDSPARSITLGCTSFTIAEDGTGTGGTPQNNEELYYTKDEADARYQQRHADGASIQFANGQHPYIYIAATGLWYPIVGSIVDGKPVIGLGAGESL